MEVRRKKVVSIMMLLIFVCTSLSGTVSASRQSLLDAKATTKEQAVALADRFIYEYEYALVDLKKPAFDYVERNDSTALFLEKLRYNIEAARVFTLRQ